MRRTRTSASLLSLGVAAIGLGSLACGELSSSDDNTHARPPRQNGQVAPTPGAPPMDAAEPSPSEEPGRSFNPFVAAAHDPFSTFAADVDSASYDIFVKSMTERNQAPSASTVRSEEWVNYFRYAYPEPSFVEGHPFEIDVDAGEAPSGDTVLLRVGVQGRDLLEDRAPANLVFLVDTSCSMGSQDKLPLAKEMLRRGIESFGPGDTISLVTYAGAVKVALPPTPVRNSDDIDTINAAIGRLDSSGGTAGADGLQLAYDQANAAFVEGGINHIILCTDGDFNIGPHSTQELLQIVESRRPSGVTFTALGFGLGNLNDEMMEAISNAGNGIYRVITGIKSAERYLNHQMLPDVVHIAKDVKLQVEFNPEYVRAYRQVGYENRQLADDDFRDDAVDAGEVGSGHQMTALYELVLVDGAMPEFEGAPALLEGDPVEGAREIQAGELVMVKLRYKAPGATEADPATEMRVALTADAVDDVDAESAFAWAVATMAGQYADNPFAPEARVRAARPILAAQSAPERSAFADLVGAR